MSSKSLLAPVVAAGGLGDASLRSVGRRDRVWIAERGGLTVVLRRCDADIARWLHGPLAALSADFPVPQPLPIFSGESVFDNGTETWEALEFFPGHAIGWDAQPSLHDVGAFLAAFHEISLRGTRGHKPRPNGVRLGELVERVDWAGAEVTMGSTHGVDELRSLLAEFASDLDRSAYRSLPSCLIHGDPTTFNVVASGEPPHPVGLIDFELADVEAAVADVAFCLWRSGRPHQQATRLDLGRVRELVSGYQTVRALSDEELMAVPLCLRGRGVQMLVKRTRRRLADDGPLAELRWIAAHALQLLDAVA